MKYVLCVLVLISGCKSQPKDENSQAGIPDTTSMEPVTEIYEPIAESGAGDLPVGNDIFQFENDDIGSNPFVKDFDAMVSAIGELEIEKKPFRNLHDSTKTDTLVIASFGPSVIEYYKVQSNNSGFILEASIHANEVELKRGIRIGMSRKEFYSLFEELEGKPELRSVIISTMEGLNQTEFIFSNDQLSAVNYQSYFD